MTAELPEALASLPRSPTFISIATGGTFWHISDWEHIANVEGSLVTAVDRLSSGCTFGSDEGLGVLAVFVWVLEGNTDEWSTSAWIVDDVLTTPLINPCLSAKSIARYLAGPLRVRVRALKIPPAPLRQVRMIRPISNYLLDNRNRTQK